MAKDKKLIKQNITANRHLSMHGVVYEDAERIGTIELPDGLDPKRVIEGLRSGKIIIGDKEAQPAKESKAPAGTRPTANGEQG